MMGVAVCGTLLRNSEFCDSVETLEVEGVPVTVGRVLAIKPILDFNEPQFRSMVLIKTRAFSCNYRDKALILYLGKHCPDLSYCFIGSEFAGEVIEVGPDVVGLEPGDRVIGNCQYPNSGYEDVLPGIPTQHASQRYHIVHPIKLMKVPESMPDEVAAGFSIGAHTTYSMLRTLDPVEGCSILVTAAKSNTSLFVINALRKRNVNVYATSTSRMFEKELKDMGVQELIQVDSTLNSFLDNAQMKALVSEIGGFDYVFDPFSDLFLVRAIDVMNVNAKYITCGIYHQYFDAFGNNFQHRGRELGDVLAHAIVKNIHIIGNCLGQTQDLSNAIDDYISGSLNVVIDCVFVGPQVRDFFARTYNTRDRFGKVIYQYTEE